MPLFYCCWYWFSCWMEDDRLIRVICWHFWRLFYPRWFSSLQNIVHLLIFVSVLIHFKKIYCRVLFTFFNYFFFRLCHASCHVSFKLEHGIYWNVTIIKMIFQLQNEFAGLFCETPLTLCVIRNRTNLQLQIGGALQDGDKEERKSKGDTVFRFVCSIHFLLCSAYKQKSHVERINEEAWFEWLPLCTFARNW